MREHTWHHDAFLVLLSGGNKVYCLFVLCTDASTSSATSSSLFFQRLYTSSRYSDEIGISSTYVQPKPNGRPRLVDGGRGGNNRGGQPGKPHPSETGGQAKEFDDKDMLLTIVAPTCSGALLIICICAVVTFCMMRRKNKSKSVMLEPESKALMVDVPPYLVDPVEMRRQHYQTPGEMQ